MNPSATLLGLIVGLSLGAAAAFGGFPHCSSCWSFACSSVASSTENATHPA